MVRNVTLVFFSLILGVSFFVPSAVFAKEKPVAGVMEMFDNFNELEESTRGGEWDEAVASVKKIEHDYKKLVPQLKGTVDGKVLQKFGFLINDFKKKIALKDSEKVEKPFLNLQSIFLDIMDYYDYPSPPVLIIVARYVDEAKESLAKDNIDDAGEEMEEIGGFKKRIEKAFAEKGVSQEQINNFFEMLEEAEELAEKKDAKGLKAHFDKMDLFLAPYAADED